MRTTRDSIRTSRDDRWSQYWSQHRRGRRHVSQPSPTRSELGRRIVSRGGFIGPPDFCKGHIGWGRGDHGAGGAPRGPVRAAGAARQGELRRRVQGAAPTQRHDRRRQGHPALRGGRGGAGGHPTGDCGAAGVRPPERGAVLRQFHGQRVPLDRHGALRRRERPRHPQRVQPPATEAQIAYLCGETLKGLVYLHSIFKVHRDIKCSNILLTESGGVKLADFGVAAQLTRTMSKRNTFIGTPHWMAPEVIQESRYDGKVDVWALGISAIEMAEIQPPRHDVHPMRVIFMITREPSPRLASHEARREFEGNNEAWSAAFHDFINQCLRKETSRRPTATELLPHRFLQSSAGSGASLVPMITQAKQWAARRDGRGDTTEGGTKEGGTQTKAGGSETTGGSHEGRFDDTDGPGEHDEHGHRLGHRQGHHSAAPRGWWGHRTHRLEARAQAEKLERHHSLRPGGGGGGDGRGGGCAGQHVPAAVTRGDAGEAPADALAGGVRLARGRRPRRREGEDEPSRDAV